VVSRIGYGCQKLIGSALAVCMLSLPLSSGVVLCSCQFANKGSAHLACQVLNDKEWEPYGEVHATPSVDHQRIESVQRQKQFSWRLFICTSSSRAKHGSPASASCIVLRPFLLAPASIDDYQLNRASSSDPTRCEYKSFTNASVGASSSSEGRTAQDDQSRVGRVIEINGLDNDIKCDDIYQIASLYGQVHKVKVSGHSL